ncbi:hypothetical protein GCM10022260_24360 [Gaetbulibacter aestuarii]
MLMKFDRDSFEKLNISVFQMDINFKDVLFFRALLSSIFVLKFKPMITSDQIKDLNTRLDKLRHYL